MAPDAGGREPIEPYVRDEAPPDDAVVVVRGGPIAAEKLVEHALRQAREYTYRSEPMHSVSVSLTVADWTVDAILAGPMSSRTTVSLSRVGPIRAAGFTFLPTYDAPHYDLVLATAEYAEAARLLTLFEPAKRNPYKRRGR
jgi:hypothetical protein